EPQLGGDQSAVECNHADVRQDHWPITDVDTIRQPERARCDEECDHAERQIARVSRAPGTNHLRHKRRYRYEPANESKVLKHQAAPAMAVPSRMVSQSVLTRSHS